MSEARDQRERRRQLGKFYTPPHLAERIVSSLKLTSGMKVLEPSCGDGSFVIALQSRAAVSGVGVRIDAVEIESIAVGECKLRAAAGTTVWHADFLEWSPSGTIQPLCESLYWLHVRPEYDLVIGNPPFGATIAPHIHDPIDSICGQRMNHKIKKESYALFIVKAIDHLKLGGHLVFICSDTFLTINTMRGLRKLLYETGEVVIERLGAFSDETVHPMVVFRYQKTGSRSSAVVVDGKSIGVGDIEKTRNLSWALDNEWARYFTGRTVGDLLVGTGGMTIGNNNLFVRDICDGVIEEPYEFQFFDDPITLEREISRARNRMISSNKQADIKSAELRGDTRRNVRWQRRPSPLRVALPHPDYRYYNKSIAGGDIIYTPPRFAIYWKDEGEAVETFKKNGNWYLHGVGGKPFFGREGITWSLVSTRLKIRYLPPGYILDSGAPCAFVRAGVDPDELYFLMAWGLSNVANRILKEVINHTRNIQGKDFERLPYPTWVERDAKADIIARMRGMVDRARGGERFNDQSDDVRALGAMFEWDGSGIDTSGTALRSRQLSLFS